jgi:NADH:ubiquinone oxidoreductase subunit 3 (subunit A)
MQVAAASLGAACLLLLGAYAVAVVSVRPTLEEVLSAVGFVAIAVTGFLYAWRLGAGGLSSSRYVASFE